MRSAHMARIVHSRNFAMLNERKAENYVTVRYIYVVSRDHPWLYRHLLERFQDDRDVDVILDRRVAERRAGVTGSRFAQERRKKERRRVISADDDLRSHSHYIVEL